MDSEPKLVALLQDLVSIPSVNPEDTSDDEITGEGRLADYVASHLEKKGFGITWYDKESGRPNVVARFGPDDAKRTVMVEAHLDTVSVKGMSRDPFSGDVEDGRLYGRGACDTKGPMAAALYALSPDVLAKLAERGIAVLFIAAMGEEKGNQGADALVKEGIGANQAIILEPTECSIVHAHKGALWLRVEIEGRPGHASSEKNRANAILAMSEVITFLQSEVPADLLLQGLGKPTFNAGKITGGSAVNIIAQKCSAEFDRRYLPSESSNAMLERLADFLEVQTSRRELAGYTTSVIKDAKPFFTTPDGPLVSNLKRACEAVGLPGHYAGSGWYSDAGSFAATCDEVVVFGPGSITQAHSADEYIDLDSLQKGCDVLRTFFDQLSKEEV